MTSAVLLHQSPKQSQLLKGNVSPNGPAKPATTASARLLAIYAGSEPWQPCQDCPTQRTASWSMTSHWVLLYGTSGISHWDHSHSQSKSTCLIFDGSLQNTHGGVGNWAIMEKTTDSISEDCPDWTGELPTWPSSVSQHRSQPDPQTTSQILREWGSENTAFWKMTELCLTTLISLLSKCPQLPNKS